MRISVRALADPPHHNSIIIFIQCVNGEIRLIPMYVVALVKLLYYEWIFTDEDSDSASEDDDDSSGSSDNDGSSSDQSGEYSNENSFGKSLSSPGHTMSVYNASFFAAASDLFCASLLDEMLDWLLD